MKIIQRFLLILSAVVVFSSMGIHRINYKNAKNKNVCKEFRNDVLAYFIFVDTKETSPWTEFDIRSTLDSVGVAVSWLNQQALSNNVKLRIRANYYIGKPYATIKRNLNQGSVQQSLSEQSTKQGLKELNVWADNIAKKVGSTLNIPDKDGIPEVKNPKNKERLIAYLRDENNVESVALIFMVNNYYRDDVSIAVNIFNTNDVEFSIVSYKYPAEIAHNILALFGAAPMNKSVYRTNEKKIKQLEQEFPNEIMLDPYGKNIKNLTISPYTAYLIGWQEQIGKQYESILTDGIVSY